VNQVPQAVSEFLAGRRFAVAGVSRSGKQPANAIFRKLRDCGFDVVPINPNADRLEGATCYPDLASVPGSVDGLMVVTHPTVAAVLAVVTYCANLAFRARPARIGLPGRRDASGWMSDCLRLAAQR